jgi:hypothetical protein
LDSSSWRTCGDSFLKALPRSYVYSCCFYHRDCGSLVEVFGGGTVTRHEALGSFFVFSSFSIWLLLLVLPGFLIKDYVHHSM